MHKTRHTAESRTVLMIGLVLAAAPLSAIARPLACPEPHPVSSPGVIRDTSVQLAETGRYLAGSSDPNRVPEIIADLRKRYPGVSDSELTNYLIAAYCPEVRKLNGLGQAEQRARLDRFASQVETAASRH